MLAAPKLPTLAASSGHKLPSASGSYAKGLSQSAVTAFQSSDAAPSSARQAWAVRKRSREQQKWSTRSIKGPTTSPLDASYLSTATIAEPLLPPASAASAAALIRSRGQVYKLV